MRTTLLAIVCACLGPAIAAQSGLTTSDVEVEVLKVEDAVRLAKLQNDTAALGRILADDYSGVNQGRVRRNKSEMIDLFRTFKISLLSPAKAVVQLSGDVAIVNGSQTERNPAGEETLLFMRVYVKRDGRWQLLSSAQFTVQFVRLPEESGGSARIEFQEMSFELPDSGWQQTPESGDQGIQFTKRSGKFYGSESLSIWAVHFPEALRSLNQKQHASAYFDHERRKARPPVRKWDEFTEGERRFGIRVYPTMEFRMLAMDMTPPTGNMGLFLLYFPPDFEERHAFYCFMWGVFVPIPITKVKRIVFKDSLKDLDSFVSSFRVRPLAPPPQAPAEQPLSVPKIE
jgi:Domain of unknown function (DUF4440)